MGDMAKEINVTEKNLKNTAKIYVTFFPQKTPAHNQLRDSSIRKTSV